MNSGATSEFPIQTLKQGDRIEVDLKPATVITVHAGYVVVREDGRQINKRAWPEQIQPVPETRR